MSNRSSLFSLLITGGMLALSLAVVSAPDAAHAESLNSSSIISDGAFTNVNAMSAADIQSFLTLKGGFLKDFSEGGRSAAQIIYDAAHGSGDATGSINGITINSSTGTVNPQVILVTLQKEQSLITMTSRSDAALRTAMGYGCPDSGGCNSAYAGFTKQVENAAWQLRYNYERAQGRGFSDYQVGQNFCFADVNGTNCGTFGNKATAALYRYTPHVYNGNYNFWLNFTNWFSTPAFAARWGGQSDSGTTLLGGQSVRLSVTLVNVGTETWNRGGNFPVRLGTSHNRDRISPFIREDTVGRQPSGWTSPNRVVMEESSVAPGELAHFSFYLSVPQGMAPGTYREYFQPVADSFSWMNDMGIYWDITVPSQAQQYQFIWGGQTGNVTVARGEGVRFSVALKNTGLTTWTKGVVHLGTSRAQDRISSFIREDRTNNNASGWTSPNRIAMEEDTVAPGEIAHFTFYMTPPSGMAAGIYREYFQPVADGITWMRDTGIYWDITVR